MTLDSLIPGAIAFAGLCVVTAIAARTDLRTQRVPNRLTYVAMLGALVFWTIIGAFDGGLAGAWHGWLAAFGGLLAGLIPYMILVFVFGGLGGGDAKLMGAVGAISASWVCVVSTSIYAMIVALCMAVFIMLHRRLVRQTFTRVYTAALLSMTRSRAGLKYDDSPQIPFALAIAFGAAVSGAEVLLKFKMPWSGYV